MEPYGWERIKRYWREFAENSMIHILLESFCIMSGQHLGPYRPHEDFARLVGLARPYP